jgi:hypothetical protein
MPARFPPNTSTKSIRTAIRDVFKQKRQQPKPLGEPKRGKKPNWVSAFSPVLIQRLFSLFGSLGFDLSFDPAAVSGLKCLMIKL